MDRLSYKSPHWVRTTSPKSYQLLDWLLSWGSCYCIRRTMLTRMWFLSSWWVCLVEFKHSMTPEKVSLINSIVYTNTSIVGTTYSTWYPKGHSGFLYSRYLFRNWQRLHFWQREPEFTVANMMELYTGHLSTRWESWCSS